MSGRDVDDWYGAMMSEMKSIIANDTWELVARPADKRIFGSCMVLRNKHDSEEKLERRKTRLVAQVFAQQPGVHFNQSTESNRFAC